MTWVIVSFVMTVLLLHMAMQVSRYRHEAREALVQAYNAVAGLSDVAEAAYQIAEFEFRTADSMTGGSGSVPAWFNEKNPAARRAKLRGYEVWRNERIAPLQARLRAGYKTYEKYTRRLVEKVSNL